jgi:hypothetical protein
MVFASLTNPDFCSGMAFEALSVIFHLLVPADNWVIAVVH